MAVSSTQKIGSSHGGRVYVSNSRSQLVENIDTSNNVLVRDDTSGENTNDFTSSKRKNDDSEAFNHELSTSIDALTMSGIIESQDESNTESNHRVNVYNNNQTIVKDDDVERIGRDYLKHFYEKNEPIVDVDELV